MLTPGTHLGPYEILAPIGAGGMGEVYRGRDTRLDRFVAIKILSPSIAASADARQRFEREARTVSQLSHPHICAIYDVGQHAGTEYLVMELLDGETLAERLAAGALSIELTLKYAAQMADALDKAHRQGIVHRDLKPANVMLTKGGVKLLDFGLAKAVAPIGSTSPSLATVAAPPAVSAPGGIIGTVQYMAPEQLEGRPVDHRSDIYALGAVLYEMATGTRSFRAPLRTLPSPALDRLVRTCLAADPDDRWQSAHDVALQLQTAANLDAAIVGPPGPGRSSSIAWAVAAIALALAGAVAWRGALPQPAPPLPVARFSVAPPPGGGFYQSAENTGIAVSPDGSALAFSASDASGVNRVWIRPVNALEATPLVGTDGATSLFWAPDGRSLAFFTGSKLRRIDLPGGAPVTICDVRPGVGFAGTWGAGGEILFSSIEGEAIYRASANGSVPAVAMKTDPARNEARLNWPVFLPDGRRFLYLQRLRDGSGHLMVGQAGQSSRTLGPMQSNVQYVEPGYLVFASEGALLAQRFDASRGEIAGAPFSIADVVSYNLTTAVARFAASASGTLLYQSRVNEHTLEWFDRSGRRLGSVSDRGEYQQLRISPDGRTIGFSRARGGATDVWQIDVERRTETRLTLGASSEGAGPWTPDGRSMFFGAVHGAPPTIFRKTLTTGAETAAVPASGTSQQPEDVSPDGKTLLYTQRGAAGSDIWMIPIDGSASPRVALSTPFDEFGERFSPDGRYFSFASTMSGGPEIYLSPFPPTGETTRVSAAGGGNIARWARDGHELVYQSLDNHLLAVPIQTSPALRVGSPVPLFDLPPGRPWYGFDVSPDGRLLAIVQQARARDQPLTVVLNWTSGRPR